MAYLNNSSILQLGLLLLLPVVAGCQRQHLASANEGLPTVLVRPAPSVRFPGAESANPQKPGDCDCNSPAHWDGGTLYVFNSAGHPWRSSGPDLFHLNCDYRKCQYNNQANGGRWIEATWKADDGVLYGWYHFEPNDVCVEFHPNSPHLTAPKIGALRSKDNGATWTDLGIVLESAPEVRCDSTNYYFAGGNGDFSVMLDGKKEFLYFLISTYGPAVPGQGVSIARMPWADRDRPAGKVSKWHNGRWAEPGLAGNVTPIFPAKVDWHRADADAFWGPSIHWNGYLRQYVILLNRAVNSRWKQEGVYISFNRDLADPGGWSKPRKVLESQGDDRWYPQVIGLQKSRRETDKVAGRVARLFLRGESRWEIQFYRAGEAL